MRKYGIPLILLLVAAVISLWGYPKLPDNVATHWGMNMKPNGYSPRWQAVLIMPATMIVLYLVFILIPVIDPKKGNYARFKSGLDTVMNGTLLLLLIGHSTIIAYGLGYPVDVSSIVVVTVGLLFVLIGNVMPRFQANYFVGIRTPWTLSSEEVWRKTHHLSGWIFVLGGLVVISTVFLSATVQFTAIVSIALLIAIITMAGSYYYYKQETRGN